jgi:hypothetical protein
LPAPRSSSGVGVSFANLFKKAEHVRNTNSRERVLRVLANASEFRTPALSLPMSRATRRPEAGTKWRGNLLQSHEIGLNREASLESCWQAFRWGAAQSLPF